MGAILPAGGREIDDGCRRPSLAVSLKTEPVQYSEPVLGDLPPVVVHDESSRNAEGLGSRHEKII
jgi:hypothetical protein